MKKILFSAALSLACALSHGAKLTDGIGQDPSKVAPQHIAFHLGKGETEMDLKAPLVVDRLECSFLSGSKTLKIERVRNLAGIPYLDHRTNDGEVVGWEITDQTTFDKYPEYLLLPLKKRSGGMTTNTFTRFKFATCFVRGVRFDAIEHSSAIAAEGAYCDRIASYVFYYFGDDCLYTSATSDLPQYYCRFANPWRFDYDSTTKLLTERVQREGTVPQTEVARSYTTGSPVTNSATHVVGSDPIAAVYARAGVPVPPPRQYGVIPAGATGVYEIVTQKKRTVRTENVAKMVDPDGNVVDTWTVSNATSAVVQEGSFTNHVVFWAPFNTDREMFVTPFGDQYYSENAFKSTANWETSNVLVRTETTYFVERPKVVLDTSKSDVNMYVPALFGRYGMPTNLVYDALGNATALRNMAGYVVTNFAVWSSCSVVSTNVLVNATVGKTFNTNLTDAVLLPGDRLNVTGTAMPTGYIIGIGRK